MGKCGFRRKKPPAVSAAGGFDGLGVYMTRVRKSYAYDEMFASIIVISALSLVLMGAVGLLERACMPWKHRTKRTVDARNNHEGECHER